MIVYNAGGKVQKLSDGTSVDPGQTRDVGEPDKRVLKLIQASLLVVVPEPEA